MTILVNGAGRELEAIGKNGIEWTNDLLGNYGALHTDEDGNYTMTEDDFEWWAPVVDMLNEINDLEDDLGEEIMAEYAAEDFSYSDLDDEARARLEWLKAHVQ